MGRHPFHDHLNPFGPADRRRRPDGPGFRHDAGRGFGEGFAQQFAAGFGGGPGFPGFGPGFGPGGFGPGGFGPRGRRGGRGGRAGRGDVRAALLSLLSDGPQNGYGLMKAVAERTQGAWRPSPGSVYPTLQQLVDEGLVEPTSEGRSTTFALTDDGRAHVAEHAEELARAWEDATPDEEPAHDASLHEATRRLLAVLHQVAATGTPEQRTAAAARVDEARKALHLLLAE